MATTPTRQSAPPAVPQLDSLALVKALVVALDAKKAGELRVLSVGEHSNITDYIIVASGQASPHLRALRVELERVLDAAGAPIAGVESSEGSGWVVFDAYQIMVHLFMPEQRDVYKLEQLWRDAEELDVAAMLALKPKPASIFTPLAQTVAKKVVKKAVAAKKTATKKVVAKKTTTKKATTKKAVTKKAATKKAVIKKAAIKKVATKKTAAKTAAKKKSA